MVLFASGSVASARPADSGAQGSGRSLVIVTSGGRQLAWPVSRVEAVLRQAAAGAQVAGLFHGACRGADALVDLAARRLSWPVLPMPAQWSVQGISAGPIRNGAMLRAAAGLAAEQQGMVLLVALPGGRGTAHCVELAERLSRQQGLPIAVARIGE